MVNNIEDRIVPLKRAPRIYSRTEHNISRSNISDNALKVLYRLKNAGYRACLVGGSVRDLLLGREPKDFDVVTDALRPSYRQAFPAGPRALRERNHRGVHLPYRPSYR